VQNNSTRPDHHNDSLQDRINEILNASQPAGPKFAGVELAEEVDELEFRLAQAQREMRAVQSRIDELQREIGQKRRRAFLNPP